MTTRDKNPEACVLLDWELRRYVRRLTRSLARMDHHLADDLEQDAYLSALQEMPHHRPAARSWMRAVVRHRFLNIRNRRFSMPPVELLADEHLAGTESDPSRLLELKETADALRASVQDLPEIYAFAVNRRFIDGAHPDDIADELDVPLETVRTRLRRGLHRLRRSAGVEAAVRHATWRTAEDEQTPPQDAPSQPRRPASQPAG